MNSQRILVVGQDRGLIAQAQAAFATSENEVVGSAADSWTAATMLSPQDVDIVVFCAGTDLPGELERVRRLWRGGLVLLGKDDDITLQAARCAAAALVLPPYSARQLRAAAADAPWLARRLNDADTRPHLPAYQATPAPSAGDSSALATQLFATWPDLVCVLDVAGTIEYVNDAVEALLGYRADEVIGQNYRILLDPDDQVVSELGEVCGTPVEVTLHWRHRHGPRVPLNCYLQAATAPNKVLCIGRDLAPLRRAEAALLASEERYRLAGRAANDILWDRNLVTHTLTWSEALYTRTGYRPHRIDPNEEWWYTHIHPEDRERVRAGIHAALAGSGDRWSDEYRLYRADDTYIHILDRGTIVRDERGRAVRMVGSMVDVTQLRAAQDALRESESRFRLLAQATQEVVWDWDMVADSVMVSDTLYTAFELTREACPPDTGWRMARIHPDDAARVTAGLEEALAGSGETWSAEYRLLRGDGNYATVLDRGFILRGASGVPRRMIGSLLDLTPYQLVERQLEESQRRLEHAQKMEAVGRLAGGVAHDFNNLLTVIGSYGDLAFHKLSEGDPVRRYISQIRKATGTATTLTRQLLALSRRQVLQPKILNLNGLIDDIDGMVRSILGPNIQLRLNLDPELGQVEADESQLHQVLLNLVVNAKDAMPEGGVLVVETRNFRVTPSHALQNPQLMPGSYLRVTVADSGIGMDSATLARIFEPFFTTKPTGVGTGLGLATVYGIIQQSHGSITVYSEVGRGTTFHIYLPRADKESGDTSTDEDEVDRPRGVETVLVVEDEGPVRELVKLLLQEAGYRVLVAADPQEALHLEHNYSGPLDLLLTDVVMPHMSGQELAREVLLRRPTLRVIYMSGYSEDVVLYINLVDAGVPLIEKPFAPAILLQTVRRTLDQPKAALPTFSTAAIP